MKELKDLQVGDSVMVYKNYGSYISQIQKITPKGFIVVDGRYFYQNGMERSTDVWQRQRIKVATDDDIAWWQRQVRIRHLSLKVETWLKQNVDVKQLEKLEKIYSIIKGGDDIDG